MTSQLQQFCESYSRALKQLEKFPNLQLGLQLLRVSMGVCRGVHLLRTLQLEFCQALAANLSNALQNTLSNLLDVDFSQAAWTLASFSFRNGGMGLQDPIAIQPAAYISSSALQAGENLQVRADLISTPLTLHSYLKDFPAVVAWIQQGGNISSQQIQNDWSKQHWWAQAAQAEVIAVHRWEKRCRQLFSVPHASDWLRVVPNGDPKTHLSNTQVKALVKFRLAMPQAGLVPPCQGCHEQQDQFGDHALSCVQMGRYARHNDIRETLRNISQHCGLHVHAGEAPPLPSGRRPDLLIDRLGQGRPLAIDVSCSHPLHPSSYTAENDATASIAKVVEQKNTIYLQECGSKGWRNAAGVIRRLATWGVAQYGGEATAVQPSACACLYCGRTQYLCCRQEQ